MTKKVKLKISARLFKKKQRRNGNSGPKNCRFCASAESTAQLDYKNAGFLKGFMTERGKILPSRISGVCCKHQRVLSSAVRKSRTMALLPYSALYFHD